MGASLRVALIQQHAIRDIQKNIDRGVEAFRNAAHQGAGLIIFAELAFTPFYPQRPAKDDVCQLAETIPGPTVDLFSGLAKEFKVVTVLNLYTRTKRAISGWERQIME